MTAKFEPFLLAKQDEASTRSAILSEFGMMVRSRGRTLPTSPSAVQMMVDVRAVDRRARNMSERD